MFFFLPETSQPNILLRRAERLRKLTGSDRFMSQSEIDMRNFKPSAVFLDALIKPIEITVKDPAILFVQVYTAIIYGIYYSFFEVFPLVYPVYYHMNAGQIGLVFLCILVACFIGIVVYVSYLYYYLNPRIRAHGFPVQESRLIPALIAAFGPTIGLFIFAWTARESIHWIAPTIGITIYAAAGFVVMVCCSLRDDCVVQYANSTNSNASSSTSPCRTRSTPRPSSPPTTSSAPPWPAAASSLPTRSLSTWAWRAAPPCSAA